VVVDKARNDFLAHSALTDDEHGEVGIGHLEGNIDGTVERIAVAHDVVPIFDVL
jgi:hypothetical protein